MFGQSSPLDALLHRRPPTPWELFTQAPCVFLARKIYYYYSQPAPQNDRDDTSSSSSSPAVSVVCISDTHNLQPTPEGEFEIPPAGDILIHAGDLTQSGTWPEIRAAASWIGKQPHPIKIVIAGNHDISLDPDRREEEVVESLEEEDEKKDKKGTLVDWWGRMGIIYLQDSSTTVRVGNRNLNVYGGPFTPRYGGSRGAFQYHRRRRRRRSQGEEEEEGENIWKNRIPEETDILITHGPPMGHLDLVQGLGCRDLLGALWRLRSRGGSRQEEEGEEERENNGGKLPPHHPGPLLHVCGHIHAGHGREEMFFDGLQGAYEKVVLDKGGLWNLVMVLGWVLVSWVKGRGKGRKGSCQLVNAAIMGGLRDEVRRKGVKVFT